MAFIGMTPPEMFDEKVNTILAVQDAVLSTAPENKGIPFDRSRELSDLYAARSGLCFDRSHAIEKILDASRLRGQSRRHLFHEEHEQPDCFSAHAENPRPTQ